MAVSKLSDLEITIHRSQHGPGYSVALRFTPFGVDHTWRPQPDEQGLVVIDHQRLLEHALDMPMYGQLLSEMLFVGAIRKRFLQYRTRGNGSMLRVRLVIGTDASELQQIRWEALRDPEYHRYLLDAHTPFSRYISPEPQRVSVVRREYRPQLRALVAVANTSDMERFKLQRIDASTHLGYIRQIGRHDLEALADAPVTLDLLSDKLRQGCDLLYIAAHGYLSAEGPKLALAGPEGTTKFIPAQNLVHALQNVNEVPQLVVLMSCESGGGDAAQPGGAIPSSLVALGPLIATAGVPAVIAMQGQISAETASRFLKVFVEQLRETGIIDVAMAAARAAVQDRDDGWIPVLFMHSDSGELWYRPQSVYAQVSFDKWEALIDHIKHGTCTPILGPGLLEPLIGPITEIAANLVRKYELGMESPARESLPKVAQMLELYKDRNSMRREISKVLRDALVARCRGAIPDDNAATPLYTLLQQASEEFWRHDKLDPYQLLASLPCPLFVNAMPDILLEVALEKAKKQPRIVVCPWSKELRRVNGAFTPDDLTLTVNNALYLGGHRWPKALHDFSPNERNPLVYHPFGLLQLLDSLVLTEDDHFLYLVGNTKNRSKIPGAVHGLLTTSALLFIGFRLDDWGFRVLLREIRQIEGSALSDELTHVAVQIDPNTAPGTVQQRLDYLRRQFQAYRITVYWGSTEAFMRELEAQYLSHAKTPLRNRRVG